jgi:hypothetical protein
LSAQLGDLGLNLAHLVGAASGFGDGDGFLTGNPGVLELCQVSAAGFCMLCLSRSQARSTAGEAGRSPQGLGDTARHTSSAHTFGACHRAHAQGHSDRSERAGGPCHQPLPGLTRKSLDSRGCATTWGGAALEKARCRKTDGEPSCADASRNRYFAAPCAGSLARDLGQG